MRIAKIASKLVSISNSLDVAGCTAEADSLDKVLEKLAADQADVSLSDQDVAAWALEKIDGWLAWYKSAFESARKEFNSIPAMSIGKSPTEVKRLQARSNELSGIMGTYRDNIAVLERRKKAQSGGRQEEMLSPKQKKNFEFLGGQDRVQDFTTQMREMGAGEWIDGIYADINNANNPTELELIERLMGFFEELNNNPREKKMLKELGAEHGQQAIAMAFKAATRGKGISVIQDMHKDYDQFVKMPNAK